MPQAAQAAPPAAAGVVFIAVYALFMVGMLVGYVFMLISAWRLMKAHEKIACKLDQILDRLALK